MKRMPGIPVYIARRGFTLIEVLVVVAVIALLVAILLPSLQQAKEQAKITQCLANLGTLGKATTTYIMSNRDRFPFSVVAPNGDVYGSTWSYGGNRGQDSLKLGLPVSGYEEGTPLDLGPAQRPLNKHVFTGKLGEDRRPLHQPGPLRVYECPSDKGGRWAQMVSSTMHENVTCYLETGASFCSNLNFWTYVSNEVKLDPAVIYGKRVMELLDRWVPIMRKKGPSRAIVLYEDPADWALETGLMASGGFPKGFRVLGWHGKYDWHNMLFLDGHAAALYVDWSKNLPDPANRRFVSGTASWVSHQEPGDH